MNTHITIHTHKQLFKAFGCGFFPVWVLDSTGEQFQTYKSHQYENPAFQRH